MQSAKNLHVYGKALELAKVVYATTARFPQHERFGLTSQMRRAAVSIGSNIAEGCGRRGDKELVAYLYIAMGSASELEFQLELSAALEYCDAQNTVRLKDAIEAVKRMLSRLILSLREKRRPA
ncbi:four helix bundle protein [soil metagenome]